MHRARTHPGLQRLHPSAPQLPILSVIPPAPPCYRRAAVTTDAAVGNWPVNADTPQNARNKVKSDPKGVDPDVEAVVVAVLLTGRTHDNTPPVGHMGMNHTLVLPHCLNIILY